MAEPEGLAHHLHLRAGDFTRDDVSGPYDVALMANVIQYETAEANAMLVQRPPDALNPDGVLLIIWL